MLYRQRNEEDDEEEEEEGETLDSIPYYSPPEQEEDPETSPQIDLLPPEMSSLQPPVNPQAFDTVPDFSSPQFYYPSFQTEVNEPKLTDHIRTQPVFSPKMEEVPTFDTMGLQEVKKTPETVFVMPTLSMQPVVMPPNMVHMNQPNSFAYPSSSNDSQFTDLRLVNPMVNQMPMETKLTKKIVDDHSAMRFRDHYKINQLSELKISGEKGSEKSKKKKMTLLGFKYITECFTPNLKTVNFTNTFIDKEKAELLVSVIRKKCPNLVELDLWRNRIEDDSALIFCEGLTQMASLKKINLGDNDIGGSTKLKIKKIARESSMEIDLW